MYSTIIETGIINAISSVVIKETYEGIKSFVKNHNERTTLLFSEESLEANIIDEIRKISNWAYDDLFKNPNIEYSTITSRYVHLDLLLEPRREHSNSSQITRKQPLKNIILANKSNIVILGQPGSGKTTSIKYIVNSIFRDTEFLNNIYTLPLVIRLRELNKSNSALNKFQEGGIFEKLSLIFGLKIDIKYKTRKDKDGKEHIVGKLEDDKKLKMFLETKIIPYILDNQKILLILDGFDEIIDNNIKSLVISEIKELSSRLNYVNFILTSRTADYKYLIENTVIYEISELNSTQIKEFSDKWFEDSDLSKKFLKELYEKTPYEDFYTRPLLLTHLALIYSRTDEIPDKPKLIYQRIVELVLKEWNELQGIKRNTKYSTFTVERKREFLSNIAFILTTKYNRQVFTKDELTTVYKEINNKFKELPIDEVVDVIEEIETHNGLFIKSGFSNFEFSHLTIQEYFVADYIVRVGNPVIFEYSDLLKLPNELAIAVALSSEPFFFMHNLLVNVMFVKREIDRQFFTKFFERIRLEKPDFEIKSNAAIQLIILLSIYSEKVKGITYFYDRDKKSINSIEILIAELFGEKIDELINDYYSKESTFTAANKSFFLYRKRVVHSSINNFLPELLYQSKDNL